MNDNRTIPTARTRRLVALLMTGALALVIAAGAAYGCAQSTCLDNNTCDVASALDAFSMETERGPAADSAVAPDTLATAETSGEASARPASDAGALTVTSLSPEGGDDNVSIRAPIQAEFSRAVKLGSSPALLAGPGSTLLATTTSLSQDGRTLTITPVSGLIAPTQLTAGITQVFDSDGNPLSQPVSWSWTSPLWLAAPATPSDNRSGTEIAVAAGPGDQLIAATTAYDRTDAMAPPSVVVQETLSYRDPWTALGGPLDPAGSSAPSLLVSTDGSLFVAFVDHTNAFRVKTWVGSAWVDRGTPIGAGVCAPSLAPGAAGVIYALASENGAVTLRSADTANAWSSVGGFIHTGNACQFPTMAFDPTGIPYVAYLDSGSLYVSALSSGSWTPVGGAVNASGTAQRASVAVDSTGGVFVFANILEGTNFVFRLFARRLGTWAQVGNPLDTGPQYLLVPGGVFPVSLVAAPNGHLYAAWSSCGGTPTSPGCSLGFADIASGGWTKVAPPPPYAIWMATSLALNPLGNPVVAWPEQFLDGGPGSLNVFLLNR